jgi:hypothetical protein
MAAITLESFDLAVPDHTVTGAGALWASKTVGPLRLLYDGLTERFGPIHFL